jgi:hypothetical protein
MAAGTVPCPDCGRPVPADRVSCPNCGALMSGAAGALLEGVAAAAGDRPGETGAASERPDETGAAGDGTAAGAAGPSGDLEAGRIGLAGIALGGVGPGGPVPGAYLPPSTVHRAEPPAEAAPRMPLAASPSVGVAPPAPTSGWTPPSPPAPPPSAAPLQAGRASLFADLPFDAPDSVTEWLVAIGSGVASLSYLLPWISGTTSYDTSWGFASLSRLPILGLLVITAVFAILPNRVALWVRAGALGLTAGALFVGNIWPIVAGDYGDAAFGAVIGIAGGFVLIVGGVLAVAPRKATDDSA